MKQDLTIQNYYFFIIYFLLFIFLLIYQFVSFYLFSMGIGDWGLGGETGDMTKNGFKGKIDPFTY